MRPWTRFGGALHLRDSINRTWRSSFSGIARPVLEDFSTTEDSVMPLDRNDDRSLKTIEPDVHGRLAFCRNTEDVCSLFSELRSRLKPGDLVLFLSKIVDVNCRKVEGKDADNLVMWPSTEFCVMDLNGIHCKLNITRLSSVVADIYSDVFSRIRSFSISQMLYLNRIGIFINGYHNKLLQTHTEMAVSTSAWNLDPIDICRCATVLVPSSDDVDFVKLIGYVSLSMFRDMDTPKRMAVFRALSGAKHGSTLFLQGAVRHALNPKMFPDTNMISILTCYARKSSACSSVVLETLLDRASSLKLASLKPLDLCNLIWATCKFSKSCDGLFKSAEPLLIEYAPELPASTISMLLWALAESSWRSPELLSALENAANISSHSMSTYNVAICIKSIGNLKAPGDDSPFHRHVEEDIISNINHFNGLDLAMLAEGYAKHGLGSATLHHCIQECALKYAGDLPADCLAKLLWSYGRMPGKESFFSGLQFHMLQRANQFSTQELCHVLWAYAVMKFFDIGFWSNCLALLPVEHISSNKRCALLFPALSEVTTVKKDLLSVDTLRLLNHTRPLFEEQEQLMYSQETGDHIVKVLASLGIKARQAYIFNGFLLDAYFEVQNEKFAALAYGSHNTIGSTLRPTGDMILKARYLRRQGLKVIHLLREPFHDLTDEAAVALLTKQMNAYVNIST